MYAFQKQTKMEIQPKEVSKTLSPTKVIIPTLFGIAVVIYLFATKVNFDDVVNHLLHANFIWLFLALLVLLGRDAGYIYRIKKLSDDKLSWKSSLYIIILWEFASAATPSVVGGTAVAVFILNKEGLPVGKSMALVMLTALLDNSFFILAAPIAIFGVNALGLEVFPKMDISAGMANSLFALFGISYFLIAIYTVFFAFGLFVMPHHFKTFLMWITKMKWLKKWQHSAEKTGDDVITSSKELRGKNAAFWANAIFSTLFVWIARYFMLNCVMSAFTTPTIVEHFHIFSRQIALWIVMLVSPTPGSSGTAEIAFAMFYEQFLGNFSSAVALFWRLFYYYPYLFLGALFLPRWFKRVYERKPETEVKA